MNETQWGLTSQIDAKQGPEPQAAGTMGTAASTFEMSNKTTGISHYNSSAPQPTTSTFAATEATSDIYPAAILQSVKTNHSEIWDVLRLDNTTQDAFDLLSYVCDVS